MTEEAGCPDPSLDGNERKLLYRCRRGTRELDRILSGFFKTCYRRLDATDRDQFSRLLELEDSLLTDWLCHGARPVDPGFERIVGRILKSTES